MIDKQDERPVTTCERCQGEIYHGENVYLWEGKWVCVDCFKAAVTTMLDTSPSQVAIDMMLDIIEV